MVKSKTWTVRAAVAGIILFAAGAALTQISFRGVTIAHWNDLCTSGLIQFSALSSVHAIGQCMVVKDAYHATGWLIGSGFVLLGCSVLMLAARKLRRGRDARESG